MLALALLGCRQPKRQEIPLPEPSPQTGPTWSDVAPLLDRCSGCHDHSGLTPPITSWQEAAALAPLIRAAVLSREMPPWPAGPADVLYRDDPSLSDEEIDLIVEWIDAGAPPSEGERLLVPPDPHDLPRVDQSLYYPDPYAPVGDPDDVRCFVLDSRPLGETWITGTSILPVNLEAAHHILLLSIVPESATDNPLVAAWADPGPGFDCSGDITSSSFPGTYTGLGGFLPGRGALVLPEGAGIFLPANALLLVEAHYYTPAGSSYPDDPDFRFATASEVQRAAAELKLTDDDWKEGLAAAPGAVETHDVQILASQARGLTSLSTEGGLLVQSIVPHMHKYGVSTRVTLTRASGETLTLVDIPEWDFDWQLQYWLEEPLPLSPDDILSLSCTYRNDSDTDLMFGSGTDEEMCVARLLVTEP